MMRLVSCVTLATVFAGMVLPGCSGPTSPSATAPLSDRIAGIWTLMNRQLPGESAVEPPGTATFTFQITDGRAGIRADCNQCGGQAVVGSDAITVGPAVVCTRVFCPSAPYDTTFVQILSGESTATIDSDILTLRSDRGVLQFKR